MVIRRRSRKNIERPTSKAETRIHKKPTLFDVGCPMFGATILTGPCSYVTEADTTERQCGESHSTGESKAKSSNYLVAKCQKSEKCNPLKVMKTLTLKPLTLCLAILGVGGTVCAQNDLNLPDVSQAAEVKQRVALTDITVKYHRPLVNGRKIWGGLVPYGKVWRAGANENTTIEFSDPVEVEGQPLAKGVYGLHMIPNPDSWTVIFSKTNTAWGSYSYKQDEDALRVNVKPRPLAEQKEALEFEFEDLKPDSTAVTLKWEKLGVPFTVSIKDADQTLQNIRAQLKGRGQFTWQALDDAAQFCLTKKINLDEALRWADASIQNEERFDNLSTKADILKALNRPDEAKSVWDHALQVATAQQLYSYGRRLQSQKQGAEAMELFKDVAKRFSQGVYGYLAQARIKSAAGDFAGAANDAKQAQTAAPTDAQKQSIQALITRLDAKQDINK
jgi:ribosomal protein L17